MSSKDRLFKLVSDFKPTGDQPEAIDALVDGLEKGARRLTLQGVSLDKTTFRVLRGGKELAVAAHTAENLWMRRDDPDHK